MVGTGIIAGHRAAIQPNIAVRNNGSAVMVNALGLIRHSIAQFVILGGRIDQIITAIRFAQGRCFKKRVLRKFGPLSIRLLGQNDLWGLRARYTYRRTSSMSWQPLVTRCMAANLG